MIPEVEIHVSDGVRKIVFDAIAWVDDADYSWSASVVLKRRADGSLFFAEQSGCSCYSFGDLLTVADLVPLFKFSDARNHVSSGDWELLVKSRELNEEVYR